MKTKQILLLILAGAITGIINGFFGGGGGMIVVPMLTLFLGYTQKQAHSTAILIILPITILSSVLYFLNGNFNFEVGLPTAIGVFAGGLLGAFLLKKASSKIITIIFAITMAIAGVKLLFF